MSQCLLNAVSWLLDYPKEKLIEELGHDGKAIIFPSCPEPLNRRGYVIDEFIDWFMRKGIAAVCVTPDVWIQEGNDPPFQVFGPEGAEKRLAFYMQYPGIIIGKTSIVENMHAVAWTGKRAYEAGRFYESHELPLTVDQFYPLLRIKSPLEHSK